LLLQKIYSSFTSRSAGDSLSEQILALLDQQKKTWRQLAEGYKALDLIRLREVQCDGYSVRLQFNPKRIVSSGARVDAKTISERKCFLCIDNLPEGQKGILYQDQFLMLCNPAPIFSQHYTISNVNHTPQEIEKFLRTFFSLAEDLSPGFTVYYNGPKCGASAPDHMHFQACPSGVIPVERDVEEVRRRGPIGKVGAVSCFMIKDYGRRVLALESADVAELESYILDLLRSMKKVLAATGEPMFNILSSFHQNMWRVIIFPRRKHRPDVFFRKGDMQVLISPAAVDIGGLIIAPIEKDFQNVDAKMIQNIFEEVSITKGELEKIISGM
jgi:hypothetical protein